jgi:hypothetical protein
MVQSRDLLSPAEAIMPGTINGIGTRNIGRANYFITENDLEEFDTTLWFTLLFIPIFPIKSYRIRQEQWFQRKKNLSWNGFFISQNHAFAIIGKRSLNWLQILKTYSVIALIGAGIYIIEYIL